MSDDLGGRTAELTAPPESVGSANVVVQASAAPSASVATRHENRTLLVAVFGTFLALALFTTPFGSLEQVAAVLNASSGEQTWMLSSMSAGSTAGLLIAGALADDYGRRRMFVAGTVVVALTRLLGVVIPSAPLFIIGRIGQGLGAAAVISTSLGLIGHTFPTGAKRVRASGLWGASVGAGIAFGPVSAALLNSSLGSALALSAPRAARGRRRAGGTTPAARIGVGTAPAGRPSRCVAARIGHGCAAGRAGDGPGGWTHPATVGLLAAGAVLLAAFVLVEWRTERRGSDPLLSLGLLRRPDFAAVTAAGVATGLGIISAMSYTPIVLERGLHSALTSALGIVIWSGVSVPMALVARNEDRRRCAARGRLAAGGGGTGRARTGLHAGDGLERLVPGLVIAGIGSGVLNAALGRQAVASVPPERAGTGSGVNNTARYLGSALGVAIVSVIAAHPEPSALLAGWNTAVLVTAVFSALGALTVPLRSRRG